MAVSCSFCRWRAGTLELLSTNWRRNRTFSDEMQNFYRRLLPKRCVDFSSTEGRNLFKNAMRQGTAEIYFKLAAQFRTQEEPSFCALSTLVMTLNALEVDPGVVWKGPWRWYHESMLDCCMPLSHVVKAGVTVGEFACLARCNRLRCETHYAEGPDPECQERELRSRIIESSKSEGTVIVAAYDRKMLDQTGGGHYSPLGAYEENTDKVLILDVARFKYPPHWVAVSDLFKAMQTVDPTTGKSRGYFVLRMHESRPISGVYMLKNLSERVLTKKDALRSVNERISTLLSAGANDEDVILRIILEFVTSMGEHFPDCCGSTAQEPAAARQTCCPLLDDTVGVCCKNIQRDIKSTKVYQLTDGSFAKLNGAAKSFFTALFLAWPYKFENSVANGTYNLLNFVETEKLKLKEETLNEVNVLTLKFEAFIRDDNGSF